MTAFFGLYMFGIHQSRASPVLELLLQFKPIVIVRLLFLLSFSVMALPPAHSPTGASDRYTPIATSKYYGISFQCPRDKINAIRPELARLIKEFGWNQGQVTIKDDGERLTAQLSTPESDQSTLDLKERKELAIEDEKFSYKDKDGKLVTKGIVSKKEVLAALLQRGRVTEFSGELCDIESLIDHISIRQNVVKWTDRIIWTFPEGLDEKLNPNVWDETFATLPGVRLREALSDIFSGKFQYQIGCLTACQAFQAQGSVDYLTNDPKLCAALEKHLEGRPLRSMTTLIDDNRTIVRQGKLLDQHVQVSPRNWVPGDWGYIKNTDPVSRAKYGYEGSNLVYIGGGNVSRFYLEHPNDRSFNLALRYVYSWRLPREHDHSNVDEALVPQLEKTPLEGGLLWDYRDFPSLSLRKRLEEIVKKDTKTP